MAKVSDIFILGRGISGLWLATQCQMLGLNVTWAQLQRPQSNKRAQGFVIDDWPWQGGPDREFQTMDPSMKEFATQVLAPIKQEIAIQVLTPFGPLELSGGAQILALKKFFPKSGLELARYFAVIKDSSNLGNHQGFQLLFAHTKKMFEKPLSERWIAEWIGALRFPRDVSTQSWIMDFEREVMDPLAPYWILSDGFDEMISRGMDWAEKCGVQVKRNATITDISIDGKEVKGIELAGGEGYYECRRLVMACSHQTIQNKLPRFAQLIKSDVIEDSEKSAWIRSGYLLKPGSRPAGCLPFSSFVIDPLMPLIDSNCGLIKWTQTEIGDHMTVWIKSPYNELRRRGYLMSLGEKLQKQLEVMFPRFKSQMVTAFPFDDYFHSSSVGHDELATVYSDSNKFGGFQTNLRNVHLMGPIHDEGLDLFSRLKTEKRLFSDLHKILNKELKKGDRKIHAARDGQNLVSAK